MKPKCIRSLMTLMLCCLAAFVLMGTALAADIVASGTCGADDGGGNLTWTLDSEGTLTIRGRGAMSNNRPWYNYRDSLKSVKIEHGVTSIRDGAFSECTALTSIGIPNSVTTIGNSAFSYCSSLTSVTIPEGVTSIGGWAFSDCSGLTSVTIPEGVTSIGGDAFGHCTNLTRVDIADLDAWCRISFANPLATPMYYAKNVYCNGDKIVAVTVPEGVKALNYTFYGFQDLIHVTLPGSLTAIGDSAFSNCGSLTRLDIPNGVTSIGSFAFSGCSALASVSIPKSVTSIGGYAFEHCTRLTSVTIPEGVSSIGDSTFQSCECLTSVSIPGSVTSIGRNAFFSCMSLTSIAIPEGVTSIGDRVFYSCRNLASVTIPSSVTSIGADAFDRWSSSDQDSVSITDIAAWCRISFANERSNPLRSLGTLYLNGTKVETLEIPEGTQVISQYAFINARCIKRVALPKSLIGVAGNAFSGCTGIEKVYYAGSENEWKDLSISNGNEPLTGAQIFYGSTLDNYYCRITAKVCTGGRVSVSATTAVEGETITVTATPYAGYQLDGIYVDGQLIEDNTFSVTGNHEVSAVFSLLPGGTGDYRLEAIAVTSSAGEKLQELRAEELLVTVAVKHTQESGGAVVMLAQYDTEGRYQGLLWLTLDEVPVGAAIKVTLPVDNRSGKIANLKAFVVGSVLSPVPMGNAVSFGSV